MAGLTGDERNRAVELSRLGLVFKEQGRRKEALGALEEAKGIYERLGDSAGLAACLYNAGGVFREAGITKTAEELFLQVYRLRVERGDDRYGEALVLTELGNLYQQTDRLEDAVRFFADASKIAAEIGAARLEGFIRTNAARALQELGRHDEARREQERALECKGSLGPAASP